MEQYEYLLNKSEEIIKEILKELNKGNIDNVDIKVIPLLLFRKILEKSKAIQILNANKSGDSTLNLARSIVENYWYLMFMIEKDTEFRSLSYCFFNAKEGITKQLAQMSTHIKRYYKDIKEHKESISTYQLKIDDINEDFDPPGIYDEDLQRQLHDVSLTVKRMVEVAIYELNDEIVSIEKEINRLTKVKKEHHLALKNLNLEDQFLDVRKELIKIKNKVKKPNWYTLKTGIENIYEVAASLKLEHYYSSYALLSQEVHSLNALNQIDIEKDNIILNDFFDEDVSEMTKSIAMTFLLHSLRASLKFYNRETLIEKIDNELFPA